MGFNQHNKVHRGAHYQIKKFGKVEHQNSIKGAKLYHYLVKIKEEDGSLEPTYLNQDDFILKLKPGGNIVLQIIESPEFGNNNITEGQKLKGSSSYTKDKKEDYEFFTTDRPLMYHIKQEIDNERYLRLITTQQLDLTAVDESGDPINQLDVADVYFVETVTDIPDIESENSGSYLSLHRMKKFSFGDNPASIKITGNSKQPQNVKYVAIKTNGGLPIESKKLFLSDETGSPQIKTKLWYGKKLREVSNGKYEIVSGGTKHFPTLAWPKEQDNLRDYWQLPWLDELRYTEELFNSFITKKSLAGGKIESNATWETEPIDDKFGFTVILDSNSAESNPRQPINALRKFDSIPDVGNDSSSFTYGSWVGVTVKIAGEGNDFEDGDWIKNIDWMLTGNNDYSNADPNRFGQSTDKASFNQQGYSVIYSGKEPQTNNFSISITADGSEFSNREWKSNLGFYNWDTYTNKTDDISLAIGTVDTREVGVSKPVKNIKFWNFDDIKDDGTWPDDANQNNTIGLLVEKIINGDVININGLSYDTNVINDDSLTLKTLPDDTYNSSEWGNKNDGKNLVLLPTDLIELYGKFRNKGEYLNRPITTYRQFYSSVTETRVAFIAVDRFETGKIKQPTIQSIGSNFLTHEALIENDSYEETWMVLEFNTVEGVVIGDEGRTIKAQDIVRHLHTSTTMWYLDSNLELCKDQNGAVIEPITSDTLSKKTKNYKIVNERTTWLGV